MCAVNTNSLICFAVPVDYLLALVHHLAMILKLYGPMISTNMRQTRTIKILEITVLLATLLRC